MQEIMAIQSLRSELNDRLGRFKPITKEHTSGSVKIIGCQLDGLVDGRHFHVYGLAPSKEVALLKARNKLIATTYHLSYPLSKEGLYGCAAFVQQSIAYDKALRSYLAQTILRQSLDGAGIPLQIPLQESPFVWENENKYSFSNYCLAVSEGPVHLALVLALALPKADTGLPVLSGIGFGNSVDSSMKRAWNDIIEKSVSDELFGEHQNEFNLLTRIESMTPDEIQQWLARSSTYQHPIILDLDHLNKEILFADNELSIVRVSEPL